MAIGKERYKKNVIYTGGAPSIRKGYGTMYLMDEDGLMYYYDYVSPWQGESRDQFMHDVMVHCTEYDGRMRISFIFASNMIHYLTKIVSPQFLGMDAELPPLPKENADGLTEDASGMEEGMADSDAPGFYTDTDMEMFAGEDGGMFNGSAVGIDPFAEDGIDAFPGSAPPATVSPMAGTENVTHEAVGSVESIADTPIPFELWLFSIKKLGQNFAAAQQNFDLRSDEEKEALMQEYNQTFGLG